MSTGANEKGASCGCSQARRLRLSAVLLPHLGRDEERPRPAAEHAGGPQVRAGHHSEDQGGLLGRGAPYRRHHRTVGAEIYWRQPLTV